VFRAASEWSRRSADCYAESGVPRFRLRYQSTNLELSVGEFVIGRSSSCNLALADGLVSRKHAVLHVSPDAVFVEDLDSRNGVAVNGVRINGPRPVTHMDRVYIGSQELVVIDAAKMTDRQTTDPYVVCEACGAINGVAKRRCGECGTRLATGGTTRKDDSRVDSASHAWGGPDTRTERARDVIGSIAAKAITMGRFDEAERMLIPHLDTLLERAQRHQPLGDSESDDPDALFAAATSYALKLAKGLQNAKWIDWVFRMHTATGRLMEAETIEVLHELVRSHDYHQRRHVRAYLQALQARGDGYGPSERFRARRVEGLAEMILAR
jgi:hypothetical protein